MLTVSFAKMGWLIINPFGGVPHIIKPEYGIDRRAVVSSLGRWQCKAILGIDETEAHQIYTEYCYRQQVLQQRN